MALGDFSQVKLIKREHVFLAIGKIDGEGIPQQHKSKQWLLDYEGNKYPPKWVISVASQYATQKPLDTDHYDAHEAVSFLIGLGFNVQRALT
ncbi:MAG: hypothetical protein ABIH70_09050 [Chloroflexota bacterium]